VIHDHRRDRDGPQAVETPDVRVLARGLVVRGVRDQGDAVDLPSLGPEFAIPVFVFQGALDNVAPVPPVRTYVDSITAPRKELVLIPGAGHNAIATKSDEFLALLIQRVRPLAAQ